jgi:hypothetical protein
MKRCLFVVLLFVLLTGACAPAAPEPTATSVPLPTATSVPPTDTPEPTATNTPLPTDTPTTTPTITPTPGPVVVMDDFSTENRDNWPECDKCSWKNEQLVYGPFDPGTNPMNSLNFTLCTSCGARKYYRMAVDVTFVSGQVDRFFGVVVGDPEEHIYYLGISPWQYYTIRDYDFSKNLAEQIQGKPSSLVRASRFTNHIEIKIQPGSSGMMDISFYLNDNLAYKHSVSAFDSSPGLAMSFHSTTVSYDNFEYEEIEAP